jgi:hypothetical protein
LIPTDQNTHAVVLANGDWSWTTIVDPRAGGVALFSCAGKLPGRPSSPQPKPMGVTLARGAGPQPVPRNWIISPIWPVGGVGW